MNLPPIEQEKGIENAIRALNRLLNGEKKKPGTKMVVAVSPEPTAKSSYRISLK
jgi:hypothetical protein